MALKGTLKDFGISEIFQLIGHQSKTGLLSLKSNEREVRIQFVDGNVIRAESSTRERRELLGGMLLRAAAITQSQLDSALEIQRRTLKRLGDILVEAGFITAGTLRDFTRLQTTETIYKLFLWQAGTYEFTAQEVSEVPQGNDNDEPIRSESVLMEGVRMVDEWPFIRRHITSYAMTFKVLKPLPGSLADNAAKRAAAEEEAFGLDAAFGAMESRTPAPSREDKDKLGRNERNVYALVRPGRDVQALIDLSRLGEFETCKALMNLAKEGYLQPIAAAATAGAGITEGGALEPASAGRGRGAQLLESTGALLGVLLLVLSALGVVVGPRVLRGNHVDIGSLEAGRDVAGDAAGARIRRALEVYRLGHGAYPETLQALVEAGLLSAYQLRAPFDRPFAYARTRQGYELVRPFF